MKYLKKYLIKSKIFTLCQLLALRPGDVFSQHLSIDRTGVGERRVQNNNSSRCKCPCRIGACRPRPRPPPRTPRPPGLQPRVPAASQPPPPALKLCPLSSIGFSDQISSFLASESQSLPQAFDCSIVLKCTRFTFFIQYSFIKYLFYSQTSRVYLCYLF